MGVKIRYGTRIGEDVKMTQLEEEFDAVLVAIGLWMGRSSRIPGTDHADVHRAVTLLRKVADGQDIPVPRSAVVIGGGNVAMDIARTMSRLQRQKYQDARVIVTALEDRAHFLADPDEIKEAAEEGIQILDARGPQQVVIEAGKVTGLKTWKILSIFDEQGLFAPKYDESDEQIHPGDMVIETIGQAAGIACLGEELTEILEWNRGRLKIDDNGRTSLDWLWSAGDMVRGPDVVSAVADGHRAAAGINEFLALQEQAA